MPRPSSIAHSKPTSVTQLFRYKLVSQVFAGKSSPAMVLMCNKVDMGHLRAVTMQKHTQFAAERNMTSYFVSAKSGDNISPAFFTIASNLAGVPVKKTHLEANQVCWCCCAFAYPRLFQSVNSHVSICFAAAGAECGGGRASQASAVCSCRKKRIQM